MFRLEITIVKPKQPIYIRNVKNRTFKNNGSHKHKIVDIAENVMLTSPRIQLTFRHRASCILGQAFHYSPEKAFYIFNQQIYFII